MTFFYIKLRFSLTKEINLSLFNSILVKISNTIKIKEQIKTNRYQIKQN